jgi:hypothetical protein
MRYLFATLLSFVFGAILIGLVLLPELATTGRVKMSAPVLVFPYALGVFWLAAESLPHAGVVILLVAALLQFPVYAALCVRAQTKKRFPSIVTRIAFLHLLLSVGVGFLYFTGVGPFSPP